jgi:hypothetical protein
MGTSRSTTPSWCAGLHDNTTPEDTLHVTRGNTHTTVNVSQ